jgi:hypothetical protein
VSQSITTATLAARLVGLTIVAVDLRPFDANMNSSTNRPRAFNPILTLSDGSRVTFLVQETEVGDYGVEIWRHVASRKTK